jgi:hypothetical protein
MAIKEKIFFLCALILTLSLLTPVTAGADRSKKKKDKPCKLVREACRRGLAIPPQDKGETLRACVIETLKGGGKSAELPPQVVLACRKKWPPAALK